MARGIPDAQHHCYHRCKSLHHPLDMLLWSTLTTTHWSRIPIRITTVFWNLPIDAHPQDKDNTLPPQGDGQVERLNRTLGTALRVMIADHQSSWDKALPSILLAYRTSIHASMKETPAHLTFGRELQLPTDIVFGQQPDNTYTLPAQYALHLNQHLESAFHIVHDKLNTSHCIQKTNYYRTSRPVFLKEGDVVWLSSVVRKQGEAGKFHIPWEGPYVITSTSMLGTYVISHSVIILLSWKLCMSTDERSVQLKFLRIKFINQQLHLKHLHSTFPGLMLQILQSLMLPFPLHSPGEQLGDVLPDCEMTMCFINLCSVSLYTYQFQCKFSLVFCFRGRKPGKGGAV